MAGYVGTLVVIDGLIAWAMSGVVPWWGAAAFGVLGLVWIWAMLGGPEY